MSGPWVFVDLDGSLLHSTRRHPELTGDLAYRDAAGRPLGVLPGPAAQLLALFERAARVIPVTDRDVASFRRVTVPFRDLVVCARAGVILRPDGTRDRAWDALIGDRMAPFQAPLAALEATLRALPLRVQRVHDEGRALYLRARDPERDEARVVALAPERLAPPGWHVHRLHDQVTFAPPPLTKRAAVDWLLREGRPPLVIGLGDSGADVDLLAACDFAMTPRDGHLAGRF